MKTLVNYLECPQSLQTLLRDMSFDALSPTRPAHFRNFETELFCNAINAVECIEILYSVKKNRERTLCRSI